MGPLEAAWRRSTRTSRRDGLWTNALAQPKTAHGSSALTDASPSTRFGIRLRSRVGRTLREWKIRYDRTRKWDTGIRLLPNTVIIPTDGSKHAENAAKAGFGLAEKLDATVHALAVGNVNHAEISAVGAAPSRSKEDLTEIAAEWANELAADAESQGLEAEAVVRTGVPAEEISSYAEELDTDMIVIGTAGRTGLDKRILGSVTDKVVRTAPVPVVTVRPDGSIDAA